MKFLIPADTIKALLAITPKTETRSYLVSVCIDVRAGDAVAVTTDGHKLLALPLTLADDAPALVPGQYVIRREALEAVKPTLKRPIIVTIDPTLAAVTLDNGNAAMHSPLMDAVYPDWRKVVPLTVSGEPAQYNADYIGAFGKAHKLLGGKYSPIIRHNGYGAARVVLPGDAIGVLMPMRWDMQPLATPAWLLTTPAPVAAAA
jgi:DNA polymerase-3 subunit beta